VSMRRMLVSLAFALACRAVPAPPAPYAVAGMPVLDQDTLAMAVRASTGGWYRVRHARIDSRWLTDSLSVAGVYRMLEEGACIQSWAVVGDTLALTIVPAEVTGRTSGFIHADCGQQCPLIHWHVVPTPWQWFPSLPDSLNAARRRLSPFELVGVGGTPDFVIYGVKRPLISGDAGWYRRCRD
jgi:hypothetical protein